MIREAKVNVGKF